MILEISLQWEQLGKSQEINLAVSTYDIIHHNAIRMYEHAIVETQTHTFGTWHHTLRFFIVPNLEIVHTIVNKKITMQHPAFVRLVSKRPSNTEDQSYSSLT